MTVMCNQSSSMTNKAISISGISTYTHTEVTDCPKNSFPHQLRQPSICTNAVFCNASLTRIKCCYKTSHGMPVRQRVNKPTWYFMFYNTFPNINIYRHTITREMVHTPKEHICPPQLLTMLGRFDSMKAQLASMMRTGLFGSETSTQQASRS